MAKSSFFSGTGTNSTDVDSITSSKAAAAASASDAATSEANAAASASSASTSASNAATSASNASTSASSASTSETNASTSATSASTSATAAASSATAAAASETAAGASETAAAASETAAGASETAAAASETNAATSATSAATSATTASTGATTVTTKAAEASTSATNAATSETNAATSATNAATSETNAATSETNAASSATSAATSATNAATSASSAASAQTAAESARDATLTAYDNFDDRYLGAKTSDPSVDNDGNALVAGALYFDSTAGAMKVYTGSAWVAAYVSGTSYLPLVGGTMTGNLSFGDNDKAIFGAGSDLQIYHDGSGSKIYDSGTGNLQILGDTSVYIANANNSEYKARFITNGAVELFYDSVEKLATTSTGIDVTGTVTADALTVDTDTLYVDATNNRVGIGTSSPADGKLHVVSDGNASEVIGSFEANNGTQSLDLGYYYIKQRGGGLFSFDVGSAERMRISSGGDISFYEDTGTTAKFFWDASAMELGIGTDTPVNPLTVQQTSINWPYIALTNTSGTIKSQFGYHVNDDLLDIAANSGGIKFRTNNTETMRLTSAGNLGIGTTSPSSLLEVSDVAGNPAISITADAAGVSDLNLGDENDLDVGRIRYAHAINSMLFNTNATERMRIDSSGNVGVGTSSPASYLNYKYLDVAGGSSSQGGVIQVYTSGQETRSQWFADSYGVHFKAVTNHDLMFSTNSTERMRIDSGGNVLIGTTTSGLNSQLTVEGTAITIRSGTTGNGNLFFSDGTSGNAQYRGYIYYSHSTDHLGLGVSGFEAMRIDSSGNLLVGTTDAFPATNNDAHGIALRADGNLMTSRSGAVTARFNRGTDDGTIVALHKDGTQVGSIATNGGDLVIGTGDVGVKFNDDLSSIYPYHSVGTSAQDNAVDLGYPTARFRNAYLSGGVYLGGTGAANKLDDYEEGTWTPVVLYGGSQTGQSYSIQQGRYTKIGRNVSYYGYVQVATNSSATGNLTVGGLPFTSQSGTGNLAVQTAALDNASGNFDQPLGRIDNNSTEVMIMSGTGTNNWPLLTDTARGGAFRVFVAGNYITDS